MCCSIIISACIFLHIWIKLLKCLFFPFPLTWILVLGQNEFVSTLGRRQPLTAPPACPRAAAAATVWRTASVTKRAQKAGQLTQNIYRKRHLKPLTDLISLILADFKAIQSTKPWIVNLCVLPEINLTLGGSSRRHTPRSSEEPSDEGTSLMLSAKTGSRAVPFPLISSFVL